MRFQLTIDCTNAAFDPNPAPELARLLRTVADRLDSVALATSPAGRVLQEPYQRLDYTDRRGGWLGHYQTVRDINGNDVGRYAVKQD